MEVIIVKDIDKIGKKGQVLNVKDGYARNFLLPNGLAVPKTAANLAKLEQEQRVQEKGLENLKKQAEEIKFKLENFSLTIPVLAQEDEKLYGSITAAEITRFLNEEGFSIGKDTIDMEEPIKALGIYEIPVKLHPEVATKIKVWVVKK